MSSLSDSSMSDARAGHYSPYYNSPASTMSSERPETYRRPFSDGFSRNSNAGSSSSYNGDRYSTRDFYDSERSRSDSTAGASVGGSSRSGQSDYTASFDNIRKMYPDVHPLHQYGAQSSAYTSNRSSITSSTINSSSSSASSYKTGPSSISSGSDLSGYDNRDRQYHKSGSNRTTSPSAFSRASILSATSPSRLLSAESESARSRLLESQRSSPRLSSPLGRGSLSAALGRPASVARTAASPLAHRRTQSAPIIGNARNAAKASTRWISLSGWLAVGHDGEARPIVNKLSPSCPDLYLQFQLSQNVMQNAI